MINNIKMIVESCHEVVKKIKEKVYESLNVFLQNALNKTCF